MRETIEVNAFLFYCLVFAAGLGLLADLLRLFGYPV